MDDKKVEQSIVEGADTYRLLDEADCVFDVEEVRAEELVKRDVYRVVD